MTSYNVDYSYKIEEFGTAHIEADDTEQAEQFAREYILDTHPEISSLDFTIDTIKEV